MIDAEVVRMAAPQNRDQNRIAVQIALGLAVKDTYQQLVADKKLTKKEVMKITNYSSIAIDALMEEPELWSIQTIADMLWAMKAAFVGITVGVMSDKETEEENNENERIH